jgi:hypothetical protein
MTFMINTQTFTSGAYLKGFNMSEIKITVLPLMGSPFSFKTRAQGRSQSIASEINSSNAVSLEIIKRDRYDRAKSLGNYLKDYNGNHPFLSSIQKQMKSKGLARLSKRQIDLGYRIYKKLLTKEVRD